MPSTTKHLKRAQKHREVAEKLAADDLCRSWAAVVLFYSARDLVHAVFDCDPDLPPVCKHPKSHTDQNSMKPGTNVVIKKHYRAFEVFYMTLYSTSLGVRYEGQVVDEGLYADLEADFVDLSKIVKLHLADQSKAIPEWLEGVIA